MLPRREIVILLLHIDERDKFAEEHSLKTLKT
jgi:hypothetical protein